MFDSSLGTNFSAELKTIVRFINMCVKIIDYISSIGSTHVLCIDFAYVCKVQGEYDGS